MMHEIIAKMDGGQIATLIIVLAIIAAVTVTSVVRNLSRISWKREEKEAEHEEDQDQLPGAGG